MENRAIPFPTIFYFLLSLYAASTQAYALTVPQEITQEAIAPNSETNHPLPLMATWASGIIWDAATGAPPTQYLPSWQISMVRQGHHLIPNFGMPHFWMQDPAGSSNGSMLGPIYYQTAIQDAASMNLPITFNGPQFEQDLYADPTWFNLPADQNPNVIDPTTGAPQRVVSAFGPILPWQQLGARLTSALNDIGVTSMIALLQQWYPNPPLVQFLSNNEASREQWTPDAGVDVTKDKHYLDLYGMGQSDEFKREKVAQGWIERYRALQEAMRGGLVSQTWKDHAKFIAYEAFGPKHFARWYGWMAYSMYNTNRVDPSPLMWDGGSPSYYLMNNNPGWDDRVFSPQMETMNYDFMLKETYQLNPNFWYELSTWNGCDYYPADLTDGQCQLLMTNLPSFTPARYGGLVQFGMWLTRPRAVRNFTGWVSKTADSQPWFDPQMAAVDRVYTNPTLKTFWRNGTLVANTTRPHPYQASLPSEYASANRMFMLTTNLDPAQPWILDGQTGGTLLPVFVLARVIGAAPNRQWLIYAFSPNQDRTGVQITIPNYKTITVGARIAGAFYLVNEALDTVTNLGNGDPPTGCDVNQDGMTNVLDVQLVVNQALGVATCSADLNLDGACNVIDVQRVVNNALGGACVSP